MKILLSLCEYSFSEKPVFSFCEMKEAMKSIIEQSRKIKMKNRKLSPADFNLLTNIDKCLYFDYFSGNDFKTQKLSNSALILVFSTREGY